MTATASPRAFSPGLLWLTVCQGLFLLGCAGAVAVGAAHARHIVGRLQLGLAQRHAAGAAQLVVATHQAVAYGNPLVKHKAVTMPAAGLLGHCFQVLENAAFQVVHLLKAL